MIKDKIETFSRIWENEEYKVKIFCTFNKKNSVSPHLDIDLKPCKSFTELLLFGTLFDLTVSRDHWISSGQNHSLVRGKFNTPEIIELCDIWERWHCNGMCAGTRAQREIVNQLTHEQYDYNCAELKKHELYNDHGYVYGSKWLVERLPLSIKKRVKDIFRG